jgi:adenosylhomocysteine nucleosidase
MSVRRLGVIMALKDEATAILEDGRFAWRELYSRPSELPGGPVATYESSSFPIRLELSGVGKTFASWACAALAEHCDLMVSLGTSGGMGSERIGSLRLVKEFVEYDMDATGFGYPLGVTPSSGTRDPVIRTLSSEGEAFALKALGFSGLKAEWARAASGDCFITDAAESRALAASTGASLCDMECAAVAKLCAFRAAPERLSAGKDAFDFFGLRSVSDNADHNASLSWDAQVALSAKDFDVYLYALAGLL